MTDVLVRMIRAETVEYAYCADMAALHVCIAENEGKLVIQFTGFHHRMREFALTVGQTLSTIIRKTKYSMDNFENVIQSLRRRYANAHKDPSNAAHFWRLTLLQTDPVHCFDLDRTQEGVLILDQQLTPESFNLFLSHIFVSGGVVVRGLVHGNATESEAMELTTSFLHESGLLSRRDVASTLLGVPVARRGHLRVLSLPCDRALAIRTKTKNKNERNSVIEIYFQGSGVIHLDPWNHELGVTRVLQMLLEEPCFDQLRTKEQLGYTVTCSYRNTSGAVGFYFSIISASHDTCHLESRIEHFCICSLKYLEDMPKEEYEKRRRALHSSMSEPHTNLYESAGELWNGVTERHEYFDGLRIRNAASVLEVTKEEAVTWWRTHVVARTGRKKLIVCVDATNKGNDDENNGESGSEEGQSGGSEESGSEESDEDMEDCSEEEENKEENEENVGLEFPSSGDMEEDWWRSAYPVVELATKDVTPFKATLGLLAAPVPVTLQ